MLEVRKAQEGNQQEMSFPVEQSDDSSNTSKKDTKKNATD